ncbi:MAG: hypothetical protein Q7T44_06915 [Parvibaculum sp.]|nr:hypothetical protein [Parvibaculum sp.]
MEFTNRRLTDKIAVIPNLKYFFGPRDDDKYLLRIVKTFEHKNCATIHISELGVFAFEFHDNGPLASIEVLELTEGGLVPIEFIENRDRVKTLLFDRMRYINFVAAAIFGRLSTIRNTNLTGANYCGADSIVSFARKEGKITLSSQSNEILNSALTHKLNTYHEKKDTNFRIDIADLSHAIDFFGDLLVRNTEFTQLDLISTLALHYQASILHSQQHADACLALNVAVMESLVNEVFFSYGIVGNRGAKAFANTPHTVQHVTDAQFSKMESWKRLEALHNGGLFDSYLKQRIDQLRKTRNKLVHGANRCTPQQSGESSTVIRDILSLLIDQPIDLTTSWSYRF